MNAKQIREGHDRLTTELRSLDRSNPSNLEDFLQRYATVLPESNQLSREVQYGLLQLYKSVPDLPTHYLLKKSLVCKSLLDLADKIEPGLTKFRGEILFELQSTSVLLAQKAMEDGKMERYQAMVNRNSNFTSVLQYVYFVLLFRKYLKKIFTDLEKQLPSYKLNLMERNNCKMKWKSCLNFYLQMRNKSRD